jgi:hypothetical protein
VKTSNLTWIHFVKSKLAFEMLRLQYELHIWTLQEWQYSAPYFKEYWGLFYQRWGSWIIKSTYIRVPKS